MGNGSAAHGNLGGYVIASGSNGAWDWLLLYAGTRICGRLGGDFTIVVDVKSGGWLLGPRWNAPTYQQEIHLS